MGGGGYESDYTNKLFTLRHRQWIEEYPPMNTACSKSSVVNGDYVIVIGGRGGIGWIAIYSSTISSED